MDLTLDSVIRSSARLTVAEIAVIGGGLVGAAAALAAARAGMETVWFAGPAAEPAAGSFPSDRDLRVYALGPATRRFLDHLSIWPRLDAARLAAVADMRIFADRTGASPLHFGAYESATDRLATIVEHGALARAFDAAIAEAQGLVRVDAFADDVGFDDVDVATITTGTDDERRTWSTKLVVAADGARSAVRERAGIETRGRPYAQRAIVGDFACASSHAGTAFQWFTDEGVIALLPLAGGSDAAYAMSLVWSAPDAIAAQLVQDGAAAVAARLSMLVASNANASIGPLTPLGPLVDIPLVLQWSTRLVATRVALVGDAAHVVHPLAGQGLNLGFGDVECLVDVLASRPPFRDCGDPSLLRRYERARAEPVLAMRQLTDGLARLFASDRPDVVRLRSLGMRALDRFAPAKRFLMRQAAGDVGFGG
jgi:2-polyprenylphenol 6-hydroxylase